MRTALRSLSNVGQASSLSLNQRRQDGSLSYIMALTTVLCLLTSSIIGCAPQKEQIAALQDRSLAAFQTNLLQIAFDVATAIPVVPHIKDRSKAQSAVVDACLILDQPQRALGYIEKISDWRRGAGYADYAFYCVQHGFTNDVQHHLDLAEQISAVADQDWRRDRIKVRIAQTHLLLNNADLAGKFSENLEKSESGKIEQTAAGLCADHDFDKRMAVLDELTASGDFDLTQNALKAYVQLYDRFYTDTTRRTTVEEKLKANWSKTPYFIRIDLLAEMADCSLTHADPQNALRLVNEGADLLADKSWPAEYHIPLMARLAEIRFRCGETDAAGAALQNALVLFDQSQSGIINIDKADALIPVAGAFFATGDTSGALAVYKLAIEAAVENPNSRPRAEDLVSICLSMAVSGVEPDAALWSRIKEVQFNLSDPW